MTIGAISTLQSRMNGSLSSLMGDPLYAALWSFGSGWLVLSVLLLARPRVRAGIPRIVAAVRADRLRSWQTMGGILGGLYVLAQSYAVPIAGVALFTVASVAGQLGNGVWVDRFGLGPAGRVPVTPIRLLAAVLATVGVGIAVSGRLTSAAASIVLLPVLAALAVGAAHAAQSAINGRVNVVSEQPLATTWVNFSYGVAILVVVLAGRGVTGGLSSLTIRDPSWWVWFGGVLGILFIGVSAIVVRLLGVLTTMVMLVVGQLAGATALDLIVPSTRSQVTPTVLLGLAVTAGAVLLTARRSGRMER